MANWLPFPSFYPVTAHTVHVGPGSIFVAIKGQQEDGIFYIPQAIERGAKTIIVARDALIPPEIQKVITAHNVMVYTVDDPRYELAVLSAHVAGYPTRKLRIIGITGTKGKTTTSFLLAHILKKAGVKTALLSTVGNKIGDYQFSTQLTTPQPDYLHQFFNLCVQENSEIVVMEVAAQAVSLKRTAGIEFDGFIFTNFSQEHGEFYTTQEEYFNAKRAAFEQVKSGAPVIINADDGKGAFLLQEASSYISLSLKDAGANWYGVGKLDGSSQARVQAHHNKESFELYCPALLGGFNNYNMFSAVAMASQLGVDMATIQQALSTFSGVPGRLEHYALANGARCIIDYAHNPASYEQVLSLLRKLTDHLIVVFGAGGDRDKAKRPIMGNIATQFADLILLTADNPRTEPLDVIIADITAGIPQTFNDKLLIEYDREEAIRRAYAVSKPTSIIALLGKGVEEYQIVGTKKVYFNEREIVRQFK